MDNARPHTSDKKRPPPIQREKTQPSKCSFQSTPIKSKANADWVKHYKKTSTRLTIDFESIVNSPPQILTDFNRYEKRPSPYPRDYPSKNDDFEGDDRPLDAFNRAKGLYACLERDRRIHIANLRRLNYNTLANETRIVLIGRTRSGKSATGNSILGYEKFECSLSGSSTTKKCQLGTTYRDGCHISVVDTPGLFDTDMENTRVLQEVVKCAGLSAPGPHAFILVVCVGNPFTMEEKQTVQLFIDEFGEEILEYMIVLFTKRDDLEKSNKSLRRYIEESPKSLQYLLQKCDDRCLAFDNSNTRCEKNCQVDDLLDLIDHTVKRNRKPYYTNNIYEVTEVNIKQLIETERKELREKQEREMSELLDQTCKPLCNTIQIYHEEIKELQRQLAETKIQRKLEHTKSQQEQTERQQITLEQLQRHQEQKAKERNREQKMNTDLKEQIEKRKLDLLRLDTLRDLEKERIQKQKRPTQKHQPSDYELRSMVRNKIEKEDKTILTSLGNALLGAGKGALSGATVGLTVAGPIGAPIGAVIGGVVGFFKGLLD